MSLNGPPIKGGELSKDLKNERELKALKLEFVNSLNITYLNETSVRLDVKDESGVTFQAILRIEDWKNIYSKINSIESAEVLKAELDFLKKEISTKAISTQIK